MFKNRQLERFYKPILLIKDVKIESEQKPKFTLD